MNGKRLYKSEESKIFCGVCGGIGEYFGIDPTLIRLGLAAVALLTAVVPCLLIYILAAIIIPAKPAE